MSNFYGAVQVTDVSAVKTAEVFDLIPKSTPLKRMTSPEKVAQLVAFLASEAASGITGQNITVDGGLTMN